MDISRLATVFPSNDLEWKVQTCGVKNNKVWALVVAYVTNRAIQQRLDDVCGPVNWRNEYTPAPDGGVLCGISIRVPREGGAHEWVTKWDGAENTDIESVKGGLSNSMKRAAVQWAIGRYLYDLPETFAQVHENGSHRGKTKDGTVFKWDPPKLPAWALPKPRSSEDVLADRIRVVAIEVDTERERTGTDLTARPALALAEEWLAAEKRNAAEMTKYGNTLGAERDRLKSLPDASAAPTYDNFQAPALDEGDDGLPFN